MGFWTSSGHCGWDGFKDEPTTTFNIRNPFKFKGLEQKFTPEIQIFTQKNKINSRNTNIKLF